VTDGQHNVIARHDYAPFGQEIPAGVGGRTNFWAASDNINQKFTGQERDGETNLDFFQARYMSSGLGRFMSPDPGNAGADFTNPQSWNGYAYVLGNPLGLVDPSGMDCEDAQGGGCLPLGFWLSPINPCKWAFFCGGGSPSAAIPDLNDLLAIWLQAPSRGGRGTSAAGGGGSATATSAPAATPPATSAPAAAPPKNGFQNNKQIQACLNDYYGSEGGKVADFFSALGLVPGWSPNATENFKEIGTLTLGKYAGLKGLQTAANRFDTQEIISIFGNTVKIPSSAAAGLDVGLHALGKSATVITAVATTTDIMAHYACAMTAYPTPSVPSPF